MAKHAFIPIKILNLLHSKYSLFHLFMFLIGLSIGFVCAFYFQNFLICIQTFIFYVFDHSFSLLKISSLPFSYENTALLSPSSQPALPFSHENENTVLLSSSSSQLPSSPFSHENTVLLSPSPSELPSSPFSHENTVLLSPSSSQPSLPFPHENTVLLSPSPSELPSSPFSHENTVLLSPSSSQPSLPFPHENTVLLSPSPSELPSVPFSHENTVLLSPSPQVPMMHNMSDEDLVNRVMEISTVSAINASPYKVAFMFLTPGPLPLAPLWELFFKGHNGLFSIYVHPHPSYNDTITKDSVFYGTRITSQAVYWGDISMVDAERRLLANALLDQSNQRFVLLSDSCIPLFNFTTIYNYLVNSNLSYLSSFDDKRKSGRGRYNIQMSPNITIEDWRKGSQWFEVNRDLALRIIAEKKFYNIFKQHCHPPCYNDEHYLPTMVNILYGNMNSNRSISYVDWSIVGPHPRKFLGREITEEFLNSIRFGSTESCIYNGNTTPMCRLFARKFTPGTLNPLLNFAPLLFSSN